LALHVVKEAFMTLSTVNNTIYPAAQSNFNKTSTALNASIQWLSSGLIDKGADGPAAHIVAEANRAQIAALDSANTAAGLAQTVLSDIRGSAAGSAHFRESDASPLGVKQVEVTNVLKTVDATAKKQAAQNDRDSSESLSSLLAASSTPGGYAKTVASYARQPAPDFSASSGLDITSAKGRQEAPSAIDLREAAGARWPPKRHFLSARRLRARRRSAASPARVRAA
jgi:hypothetical protein